MSRYDRIRAKRLARLANRTARKQATRERKRRSSGSSTVIGLQGGMVLRIPKVRKSQTNYFSQRTFDALKADYATPSSTWQPTGRGYTPQDRPTGPAPAGQQPSRPRPAGDAGNGRPRRPSQSAASRRAARPGARHSDRGGRTRGRWCGPKFTGLCTAADGAPAGT